MQPSVHQAESAVNISFERVGKVIRQMKNDCGWCGPEFNAISKAATELGAEGWAWDAATRTLLIESRTVRGKRYRVTEMNCCESRSGTPCKQSGQVHWHAAAWTIVFRASQPDRVITPQTDAEYAASRDLVDELC